MDLFQTALLGLLALGVIVLGALLATLVGIRRAVEGSANSVQLGALPGPGGEPGSATTAPATGTQAEGARSGGPASTEASTEVGRGYGAVELEPVQTSTPAVSAASAPPGSAEPAASTSGTGQAATIRSVLEQHGLGETGSSGAIHQEPQAQAAVEEPVVDSVFAAHADDPQEEPFQREGRWWFRRGDELLLYDEATGQWQPAPEVALPGQPAGMATSQQAQQAATATAPMATVADQAASFWKCATCGAVNGSTAATCRMCFAARP